MNDKEQQPESIVDCPTCGRRLRVYATKQYTGRQYPIYDNQLPSPFSIVANIEKPGFRVRQESFWIWPGAIQCPTCRTTIELESYRTCENPNGSVVAVRAERFQGTIRGKL